GRAIRWEYSEDANTSRSRLRHRLPVPFLPLGGWWPLWRAKLPERQRHESARSAPTCASQWQPAPRRFSRLPVFPLPRAPLRCAPASASRLPPFPQRCVPPLRVLPLLARRVLAPAALAAVPGSERRLVRDQWHVP